VHANPLHWCNDNGHMLSGRMLSLRGLISAQWGDSHLGAGRCSAYLRPGVSEYGVKQCECADICTDNN
jgi:hypothetical protein